MNGDTLKALANKAIIGVGAFLAGRYHLSGDQLQAITADLATIVAFIGGVAHASKLSNAANKAAVLALAALLFAPLAADRAIAQTLPIKVPQLATPASLTNWSGFYAGGMFGGINQGADVISGGLNSLNAGGTVLGVNVGYMNVTPQYLLGVELGAAYQTTLGMPGVADGNRWTANVELMAGGSLNGLFGTITPPPSGAPFNLGTVFASTMPYAFVEPRIGSRTQTGGGVGAFVPLKGNVFLRAEYEYAPPQSGQGALQYPRVKIGWAF